MLARQFTPGFRLSRLDVIVLLLGFPAVALIASQLPWLGAAIAFTLGHFFLFCNIVRMDRPLELVWAAAFTLLAVATILTTQPGWPATFALALLLTVVLVAIQLRKPSYHGVLWQRINPNLPQWWAAEAPSHREVSAE
jgi:hypothetical protein